MCSLTVRQDSFSNDPNPNIAGVEPSRQIAALPKTAPPSSVNIDIEKRAQDIFNQNFYVSKWQLITYIRPLHME